MRTTTQVSLHTFTTTGSHVVEVFWRNKRPTFGTRSSDHFLTNWASILIAPISYPVRCAICTKNFCTGVTRPLLLALLRLTVHPVVIRKGARLFYVELQCIFTISKPTIENSNLFKNNRFQNVTIVQQWPDRAIPFDSFSDLSTCLWDQSKTHYFLHLDDYHSDFWPWDRTRHQKTAAVGHWESAQD